MFASSLYHIVLALVMIGQKDSRGARGALQNGFWGPKFLAVIVLSIVAFFIPNGFFIFWGSYIAVAGAALFVLFQMFLLVDFGGFILFGMSFLRYVGYPLDTCSTFDPQPTPSPNLSWNAGRRPKKRNGCSSLPAARSSASVSRSP